MSTHLQSTSEKRPLDNGDSTQGKPNFAKEFKRTKAGVWDVYKQISHRRFGFSVPWISKLTANAEMVEDMPFVWRMVKDVIKIKSCRYYLCLFIWVKILAALQPAVALWFTSYYLTLVQVAMNERRVDENLLVFASAGRICCKIAEAFLDCMEEKLTLPLGLLIKEHSDKEIFKVTASLDVPTHDDKAVKKKLNTVTQCTGRYGVIWGSLSVFTDLFFSIVRLVTEIGVLAIVISGQQDGITFAILHIGKELLRLFGGEDSIFSRRDAWAAITNDEHYLKLPGLEYLVELSQHRQEIVAGNCAEFLKVAYNRAYGYVSGKRASFYEILGNSQMSYLQHILSAIIPKSIEEVAELAYLLKSAARPETIPVSLATIRIIQTTSQGFMYEMWMISYQAGSIKETFRKVRGFYEIREIQNKVLDGTISFPEDSRSLASGITIEFRNVSFRYPNADEFVLRDLSFKIEKGKLCVIVGTNGSGKSTLLKLILRLYDPTEGSILVNDQDIKTLKLSDLRESLGVLFQDYTHFPLTIKDDIGLGDPRNAHDESRIREAARLGGAEEFIDKMAEGFDTYLDRPVENYWSIPSDAKTSCGTEIDRDLFREAIGHVGTDDPIKLSGGQMQRLAVSRMFMRSVLSEEARVGLLLFDEPSASLDPIAENDLFTNLRKLRGEKTMIFSSHRFGLLTRPADLILYMNETRIVESGTHNELMAVGGKYAELWNLQAQAFT